MITVVTPGTRAAVVLVIAAALGACQAHPAPPDWQGSLARELRRDCIARAGGPRMDSVDLFAGRLHTACAHWAHRQARRLTPH
jgi:hypothetical protein